MGAAVGEEKHQELNINPTRSFQMKRAISLIKSIGNNIQVVCIKIMLANVQVEGPYIVILYDKVDNEWEEIGRSEISDAPKFQKVMRIYYYSKEQQVCYSLDNAAIHHIQRQKA